MEQNLLDTSQYKISLLSLDSRFAIQKSDNYNEFKINSPNVIRNAMRIRLASAEIPLVEHTFTEEKGNVNFFVKIGNNPNPFDTGNILDGNYTAQSICDAVQTMLQSIHSGFTVKINTTTGLVTIANPSVRFVLDFSSRKPLISQRPTHWGLGYYLGFREKLIFSNYMASTGDNQAIAESVINVQPTPYYLLQLRCPEQITTLIHPIHATNYIECFAKLILRDNYYQVQFDDNSNLLRKEYTFLSPTTIPFFQFKLLDPWGIPIDMLKADWSVTIEVTEIVNSKTFTKLSATYTK